MAIKDKVKVELTKRDVSWIKNALNFYAQDYRKTINNTSKSKKIPLKEKQPLIKDLLDEESEIKKLEKFFGSL